MVPPRDDEFLILWRKHRRASAARKPRLLAQLLEAKAGLARSCSEKMIARSNYNLQEFRDDVLQAARIGIIRAIEKWQPERAGFATCAYFWMRHEIQQVIRHVTPITRPKNADLPRKVQDQIAAVYALSGEEPDPEALGVPASAARSARAAAAHFCPVGEGFDVASVEESPEEGLDRRRQEAKMKAFMLALDPAARQRLLDGDMELLEAARRAVCPEGDS